MSISFSKYFGHVNFALLTKLLHVCCARIFDASMASNIYKYILKENFHARQNFGVARPTELLPPAAAAACPVQLRKEEAGSAP